MLLYCGLTAAVFVFSALLPLAFRKSPAEAASSLSRGERAALFSAYWNGGDETLKTPLDAPSAETEERCEARMDELVDVFFLDEAAWAVESEGAEYFTLMGENGAFPVCRRWLQCQGDWRNWLDVCFDAESGELYYLYTSSACVTNQERYRGGSIPGEVDTEWAAVWLAEEGDYELLSFEWSGDPGEAATALYSYGTGLLRCRVSCIYYEATLIDVKIVCDM